PAPVAPNTHRTPGGGVLSPPDSATSESSSLATTTKTPLANQTPGKPSRRRVFSDRTNR
ncbi:hypothetical protein TeGR_g12423, partial [Tetraparma gracilis]